VVVELPANGSAPSNVDDSRVAFTALALLSGGVVATFYSEYTYKAACTAPAGADRTVARIPVAEVDASPGSADPTATAGSSTSSAGPAATEPASGGGVATTPPAGTPLAAAAGSAVSAPASGGPATAAPVATVVTEDGVRLPGWALLLAATFVVLAAVLLAGWSHHRVRVLRASLEG
jgi:hypothetical protein